MTATIEVVGSIEYTRGRDFFDPADHPNAHVTIVGCGGIGSFTAHALAKLGIPSLTLVDFDVVEAHNIPNQLYDTSDLGHLKVERLAAFIEDTTHAEVRSVDGQIGPHGVVIHSGPGEGSTLPLSGIVISALDSMNARQMLWEQVRGQFGVSLLIDGRLGGQNIVVYTSIPVHMPDIEGYAATLHSDEDGLDMPCTGRNVIDVGYAMAAIITRHVRQHITNHEVPKITFQDQESMTLATSGWLL